MPSAWFRPLVHNAVPPSLHGVREGPFPRFDTTMGRCDSLTPISPHFVAFAWRYHRCVPCSSPSAPDAAVDQPGVGKPGLRPAVRWRRQGLPSSRGTLVIIRHVLRPRRDQARWWDQVSLMPGAAPALDNDEGSLRRLISGLNRTAFDLAVYASQ